MKKGLLGLFIAFLLVSLIWDVKDYLLGDQLTRNEAASEFYSGQYESYEEASSIINDTMGNKFEVIGSITEHIYKLPNNYYFVLAMRDGNHKASSYLYTGFIEQKHKDVTELTFPENDFNLISTNGKFKSKSWDIKSKAGVHHVQKYVHWCRSER